MKLEPGDPEYEPMRQELGLPHGTLIVIATPKRGTWSHCLNFPPTKYVIGPDGTRMSVALARWMASPWAPRAVTEEHRP
jgi:hypothetical protein